VPALRRALDALYLAAGIAGACAFIGIGVVIAAQVTFRQLSRPLPGADDLTAYLVACSVVLPLAYAFRHGAHIRVDLVIGRLRGSARTAAEALVLILAAAMAGFLTYALADLTADSWEFGDVAQGTVPWPLWLPQAVLAFGAGVFAIALLDDLASVLAGGRPSYRRAEGTSAIDRAAGEL
jgi:TRAP-type C4-dicarboxylate transport system permease small subunit